MFWARKSPFYYILPQRRVCVNNPVPLTHLIIPFYFPKSNFFRFWGIEWYWFSHSIVCFSIYSFFILGVLFSIFKEYCAVFKPISATILTHKWQNNDRNSRYVSSYKSPWKFIITSNGSIHWYYSLLSSLQLHDRFNVPRTRKHIHRFYITL